MIRFAVTLLAVLAVLVGVDVALVAERHHVAGAFAVAGLVGGVAIVAIAKGVGVLLQRPDRPA